MSIGTFCILTERRLSKELTVLNEHNLAICYMSNIGGRNKTQRIYIYFFTQRIFLFIYFKLVKTTGP